MEPSELRINNLVTVTNGTRMPLSTVFKIVTIKLFQVDLVRHDQIPAQVETFFQKNYYELTPIPLTEDWLLKFGFIVEDTSTYSPGYEKPYRVYRKLQFTYNGIQQAWWYNGQVLYLQPQHVHQLQNLYFALTGEDLKLNSHDDNKGMKSHWPVRADEND